MVAGLLTSGSFHGAKDEALGFWGDFSAPVDESEEIEIGLFFEPFLEALFVGPDETGALGFLRDFSVPVNESDEVEIGLFSGAFSGILSVEPDETDPLEEDWSEVSILPTVASFWWSTTLMMIFLVGTGEVSLTSAGSFLPIFFGDSPALVALSVSNSLKGATFGVVLMLREDLRVGIGVEDRAPSGPVGGPVRDGEVFKAEAGKALELGGSAALPGGATCFDRGLGGTIV